MASRIVSGRNLIRQQSNTGADACDLRCVSELVRAAWQAHQRHPVRERADDGAGAGMAHDRAAPWQQQRLRHVLFDGHIGRQRLECLRLGSEADGQDHIHWQIPERIQRHSKLGGGVEKGSQGQIDGSLVRQRDDALGQHVARPDLARVWADRDHIR